MAYNGTGIFLVDSVGQPVVAATTISDSVFNALTADLATGLSTALTKNGQTTPTSNLPMGGFKFTGLLRINAPVFQEIQRQRAIQAEMRP